MRKDTLAAIGISTFLSVVLQMGFVNAAEIKQNIQDILQQVDNLKSSADPLKVSADNLQMQQFLPKDYNKELLGDLVMIEGYLQNDDIKGAQSRYYAISSYLAYYKKEITQNVNVNNEYGGDKVLYLQYGDLTNFRELVAPLSSAINPRIINVDFLKNKIPLLYYFKGTAIIGARIRYVSYDTRNTQFMDGLNKLLSGIREGDAEYIRASAKNIYNHMLLDNDDKVFLVTKIYDNLVVAKYLIDSNQTKAASNNANVADALMLKLIWVINSTDEQKRIKALRKEFIDLAKTPNANYIAEWEKVPEDLEKVK